MSPIELKGHRPGHVILLTCSDSASETAAARGRQSDFMPALHFKLRAWLALIMINAIGNARTMMGPIASTCLSRKLKISLKMSRYRQLGIARICFLHITAWLQHCIHREFTVLLATLTRVSRSLSFISCSTRCPPYITTLPAPNPQSPRHIALLLGINSLLRVNSPEFVMRRTRAIYELFIHAAAAVQRAA